MVRGGDERSSPLALAVLPPTCTPQDAVRDGVTVLQIFLNVAHRLAAKGKLPPGMRVPTLDADSHHLLPEGKERTIRS